jgi:hypothetical protein
MFEGAAAFNQPLDEWDVSSVEDMPVSWDARQRKSEFLQRVDQHHDSDSQGYY